jgi:hypothetical protein
MHSPHVIAAIAAAQSADRIAHAPDERLAREVLAARARSQRAATAGRPTVLRRARVRVAGLLVAGGSAHERAVS